MMKPALDAFIFFVMLFGLVLIGMSFSNRNVVLDLLSLLDLIVLVVLLVIRKRK